MKKRILLFLGCVLFSVFTLAQNSQGFNYQAILRDADNKIIANEIVLLRFTILQGTDVAHELYIEEHEMQTNASGLINLSIGAGMQISGDFATINWSSGNYFLQIELNRNNAGFEIMGISSLKSVPFAMHAETATNVDDADADPLNEIQNLQLSGSTLTITNNENANQINLAPFLGENTDEQDLSLSGTTLQLTNDDTPVDLMPFLDNTDEQNLFIENDSVQISNGKGLSIAELQEILASENFDFDADSTNEIQDLILNGSTLTISKKENPTQIDLSPFMGENTDEQDLSLTGTSLQLSNDDTPVDLSGFLDNTDNQTINIENDSLKIQNGNGIPISSISSPSNDDDPENEIQDITLNGTELSITSGSTIDLSSLQDGVTDADADPLNEIQSLTYENDSLSLSGSNKIKLPIPDTTWRYEGNNLFYNAGKVGIGTSEPSSKLVVKGDEATKSDDLLFAVVNNNGDTVFAVFQGGVRIYVDDNPAKISGNRGGFAVGGFSSSKGTLTNEYLRITPDSIRMYVDDDPTKISGNRGGFAVGGFSSSKNMFTNEFLRVSPDSIRMYVKDDPTKISGNRGGFAVGGFSSSKGITREYLRVTDDSTRIYVKDSTAGFSVSNIDADQEERLMNLTKQNYFIGHNSGKDADLNSTYNSFFGYETGQSIDNSNRNVLIGFKSGYALENANDNIFVGFNSGYSNNSGSDNIFIGSRSGFNNISGNENLFFGKESGFNNTSGSGNMFLGYYSGRNNTIGHYNLFVGYKAGFYNTEGYNNVFIGDSCGYQNIIGYSNTFLGAKSGLRNTSGYENVFIGDESGWSNTSGIRNTIIGAFAGQLNDQGSYNTFIGTTAGLIVSSGDRNTLVGALSGVNLETGEENAFFGQSSGMKTKGSNNVFIGANSGHENVSGNSNVFLGDSAGYYELGSNKLYIENSSSTTPLIFGDFSSEFLTINGNLGIGKSPSSAMDVNGTINASSDIDAEDDIHVGDNLYVADNIYLDPDGYIDIGTNGYIELGSSGFIDMSDDGYIGLASGKIIFDDRSTDEIEFANCNVGIGISSPGALFHVNGDAIFSTGTVDFTGDDVEFSGGDVNISGGNLVFNENGTYNDFRIEGNNDQNLFVSDAGNDNIFIGGSSVSPAKLGIYPEDKDWGIMIDHDYNDNDGVSGIYIDLDNNYSGSSNTTGLQQYITKNSGSGKVKGIFMNITNDVSSNGYDVIGIDLTTSNNGDGEYYGIKNSVNRSVSSSDDGYGIYNYLSYKGSGDSYALFTDVYHSGGTCYNIYAQRGDLNYFESAVGIGEDNVSTVGSYELYVNGNAYATGGFSGSDLRWKKNIQTLDNALNNILKLRGVSYCWRKDEFPERNFSETKQIGVVAQEIEEIFPELVMTNSDGYKAVAYDKFTAVFIEAIKEQQSQIEQLKKQNDDLMQRLKLLEN